MTISIINRSHDMKIAVSLGSFPDYLRAVADDFSIIACPLIIEFGPVRGCGNTFYGSITQRIQYGMRRGSRGYRNTAVTGALRIRGTGHTTQNKNSSK
jgi:hypothetical protein